MDIIHPIPETGSSIREICSKRIQNEELRLRILSYEGSLVEEEDAFRHSIAEGLIRSFKPNEFDESLKKDMAWYYEKRLVQSVDGSKLRSRILNQTKNRRCPFCHIAVATTLDHSFPKSTFPRLAVDPYNLVPACRDCNIERNVGAGTISISPYFDDWVASTSWLRARVKSTSHPEDLEFYAIRHDSFSDEQWDSLSQFLIDTDLFSRYADLAIDEFLPLAFDIRDKFLFIDQMIVVEIINERFESNMKTLGPNRWQTAAFSAWRDDATIIDWESAGKIS